MYGFLSEADPRVDSSRATNDNQYLVLRVYGLTNPDEKLPVAAMTFDIAHQRYTYENGPRMVIHQTQGVPFSHPLTTGSTLNHGCTLTNMDLYKNFINEKRVPDDINVYVDFWFSLEHPVQAGGYIDVVVLGMEKAKGIGAEGGTCYVYGGSLGVAAGQDYVKCAWVSDTGIRIS